MNFTPTQIWTFVIAFVGLTLTVLNIIDKVNNLKKNAELPMRELEQRITRLEIEKDEIKKSLDVSHERHREQQEVNYMFVNCMIAFIDFEVAYCSSTGYKDTGDLAIAKKALREYLTRKK